jgi:hypothetical protein
VQHLALVEVQDSAHREDGTNRQGSSTKTKDSSTESEEEKEIHPPSENVVLTDNRTSAESCTSPDAQHLSTGEEELDLEELKQIAAQAVAPIQAEQEEAEQRAARRRELLAALRR